MASSRDRRIVKELGELQSEEASTGVKVIVPNEANLRALIGSFPGPPDSPYQGGTYEVKIDIPDNYPFQPPKMKFETKVWHPNISSQTGAICLDTLTTGWSPVQTLRSALMSLQSLFAEPNPKDPQDAMVANQMVTQPAEFEQKAHDWAVKYAGAPRRVLGSNSRAAAATAEDPMAKYKGYNPALVAPFADMGFGTEETVLALEQVKIPHHYGPEQLSGELLDGITTQIFGQR